MIVEQAQLDKWRAFVEQARTVCFSVGIAVSRGQTQKAKEKLDALHDASILTAQGMEQAGARRPDTLPPPPPVRLEHLDTDANRRLMSALRAAHAAALDVDAERGLGRFSDGPVSGMLETLLSDVEQEVMGPVGRLRE